MSNKLDRAFNWELDIEAALWDNEHHRHLVQPFLDIAEAARLVANPNIKAVTKVAKHRMPFIDWSTADAVIRELVAAALTPQGDTDGNL